MPQNTYYNFGVVNEVLQLTLLFLGRVPLRRVNAILYSIALCFHGQLIEAVLKVADFRGAKGIVRGGDGNSSNTFAMLLRFSGLPLCSCKRLRMPSPFFRTLACPT